MRLVQIIASKAGIFENTILDLDKGLNIISGQSNSGKTLLLTSICNVIMGEKETDKESGLSDFWLNIVLRNNEEEYRYILNNNEVNITRLSDNKSFSYTINSSSKELRTFDTDLFHTTQHVGLDFFFHFSYLFSPTDAQKVLPDINNVFDSLVDDQSAYVSKIQFFEEERSSKTEESTLAKEIRNYSAMLREKKKEKEIHNLRLEKIGKIDEEKNEIIAEKEALIDELKKMEQQENIIHQLVEEQMNMALSQKKLYEVQQSLETQKEKEKEIKSRQKKLKERFPLFSKLKGNVDERLNSILLLFEKIQTIQFLIRQKKEKNSNSTRKIIQTGAAFGLMISIALLIVLFTAVEQIFPFGKIEITMALVAMLMAAIFGSIIANYLCNRKNRTEELSVNLENHFAEIKKLLEQNKVETKDKEEESLYQLVLQLSQEYDNYKEEQEEINSLIKGLEKEQKQNYSEKMELLEKEIEELRTVFLDKCKKEGMASLEPEEFNGNTFIEEIKSRKSSLLSEKGKKDTLIEEMDNEISQFSDEESLATEINESITSLEKQLAVLEKRERAIDYFSKTMRELIKSCKEKKIQAYTEQCYAIYNRFSGKEQKPLSQDEFSSIISESSVESIKKPQTQQLILLCTKLALNDFLFEAGYDIPLILDEPAIYMDKRDIQILLSELQTLSRKRQVIILTHDPEKYENKGCMISL